VPKESFKIESTLSMALVWLSNNNYARVFPYYMLALCSMLLVTYYASNYAGIIGLGLIVTQRDTYTKFSTYFDSHNWNT